ncbi:hypothetical protein MKW92_043850 [Papaver armeniacum]|nr:hypothetical protein MKW92_043850 [Papaver armeniacum]
MYNQNGNQKDTVIQVLRPPNFIGGLEFSNLTYTVVKKLKIDGKWHKEDLDLLHDITGYAPKGRVTAVMGPSGAGKSTFLDGLAGRIASGSLRGRVSLDGIEMSPSFIKRTSAYIMQDDRLFPMLTVYETLLYAADFRLGSVSKAEKQQRSARNTYIGDEGTRGVSGGERRRVSIGVDIIHGPALLFLDEPTSGLDSTSAQSVIDRLHDIARTGSTVILTIHQPSHRIQMLLDHLIILARGQLMYQGAPKDVSSHLGRMGRKVPKGENSIEYLLDVIQEYDQSELGVTALADFAITGMKPPKLSDLELSFSTIIQTPPQTPALERADQMNKNRNQLHLSIDSSVSKRRVVNNYDCSVRSELNTSRSCSSPGYYTYSNEILAGTPTPHDSDYSLHEHDYFTDFTPKGPTSLAVHHQLGPKFANSFFIEIWMLMRRNFTNIRRTPELFLSRQMVLTFMGVLMATMFTHPKDNLQGITNRLSFFIFTVCLFFFSSNDAVPAFIQERFIFVRESSHNAYRASSYAISGLITYLPFFAIQAATYAGIVWFALSLRGPFLYFLIVLYVSLLTTNSFVVFVSSVVPNYILGYAAVIAFTALFFLFCGYFVNGNDIPPYWKWMHIISTMTYPYEGLLMNEFQTTKVFGQDLSGGAINGFKILQGLDIDSHASQKWKKIYIMLGWAVFYRVLFYVVLRFASKNQRT